MAMLLAIYQKMRLIREVNKETLNVARFSSKVDRIAKNIKNVQKFYTSKLTRLDQLCNAECSIWRNNLLRQNNADDAVEKLMKQSGSASIWEDYKNGELKPNDDGKYDNYTDEQIKAFQTDLTDARYRAQYQQQQLQWMAQSHQQMMEAQKEMMKQAIEDEQDAALEPLEYEQTMMELDKEASEERLTRLKAELESYKQLCSQEAKDSAPKFGLG